MIRYTSVAVSAVLLAACANFVSNAAATGDEKQSHLHIGHVLTSWNDTPEQRGLLTTAMAEAEIAVQHTGLAMQQPDNLDWLKLHTGHVLHAVDPSVEAQGPGLGYGVRQAAAGTVKHVGFAADSNDASDNVKLHAGHVATSGGNVGGWIDQIVDLGKQIQAASSAGDAAPLVQQLDVLAKQLLGGVDADGDGSITWVEGEGGLGEATKHMGFMTEGEGLS
jgi:hypothetical protein